MEVLLISMCFATLAIFFIGGQALTGSIIGAAVVTIYAAAIGGVLGWSAFQAETLIKWWLFKK